MALDDPVLLGALERLQLRTRRPIAGSVAGGHRSRRHGTSLDFADFREYQPGDDFRRIDYQSLARLDQLIVRLYEAEDDLDVRILVDTSGSMGLDNKITMASQLAAAIGFVALTRRDVVTVQTTNEASAPQRFASRQSWPRLRDHLGGLTGTGAASLLTVGDAVLRRNRRGGMIVLLSDLLDPEWKTLLSRLPARGADLVIVHVLGAGELAPIEAGDVDLVDAETGARLPLSLTGETIARYGNRRDTWLADVRAHARSLGAAYSFVAADDDIRSVILGALPKANVLT